jgi:3-hydroxyacyl-[acyl-carrier-protein] dehydratase
MRYLLIDRVLEIVPGERIVAVKNVTLESSYLEHHFPGLPFFPGALIIEAFAQASGYLVSRSAETFDDRPVALVLAGVERARFIRPVAPGDQLKIEAEIVRAESAATTTRAVGTVDGGIVARALLTLAGANAQGRKEYELAVEHGRILETVLERSDGYPRPAP